VYDETSYRGDPAIDAGLDRETAEIGVVLAQRKLGRVLDVGCGTGVWTGFLTGDVTGLDQSREMLDIAAERVPGARMVQSVFPPLPFPDNSFDTVFTANFYGLLRPEERAAFLQEARRVAGDLIVLDLRSYGDHVEGIEERRVNGTVYPIFRRRFTPESLRHELGGEFLYPGTYFLVLETALR
jgi:ubiquinone/menaquinone biosynthesis C-methylase UbiE